MRFILIFVGSFLAAPALSSQPTIRVEAGDWGMASVKDIAAVLSSVTNVMLAEFPQRADVRIVVRASPAGPRVLEAKSKAGEHQVLLNVRDTRWDQFAYQFAHELCHIVSNYDLREIEPSRSHQWFEEAVCEAASIIALERLSVTWRQAAPYPSWSSYAPAFAQYAERLTIDQHRHLSGRESLASWYGANGAALERDPYIRRKNELVATALLDLFRTSGLQALGYLNVDAHPGSAFDEYLSAWYECCPEVHRALVRRVMSLFNT